MVTIVGRGTALFTADFWSLDFTSALIPINPLFKSVSWENRPVKKRKEDYCVPDAAPMIPQHQAKNKDTTRVVNQGTLERPVRGEEGRGWAWLITCFRRWGESSRLRGQGKKRNKKIYLLEFIYEATRPYLLKVLCNKAAVDTPQSKS